MAKDHGQGYRQSQPYDTGEQYSKEESPKALLHTLLFLRDLEARLAVASAEGSTVLCKYRKKTISPTSSLILLLTLLF